MHEAGPSRFSVARGWSLWIIICNHEKEIKNAFFETLHNEIKCVMSIKESNFNEKIDQNFHICLRSGPRGLNPPPLTVSLTVKYPLFYAFPKKNLLLCFRPLMHILVPLLFKKSKVFRVRIEKAMALKHVIFAHSLSFISF